MKKKLISIIMSCHNGEKYLETAINSIINQTYKNWELIFWDNYSNDNSANLLNRFKDKRIKYFRSKKKTNLAIARNNALNRSNGEFICFLDVDDFWLKDKLKIQINIFKKNKFVSLVFCNFYCLNERISGKSKYSNIHFKNLSKMRGLIFNQLLNSYLTHGFPLMSPLSVMIKKKDIEELRFDKKLHILADFDLFLKLSENKIFYGLNKGLAVYRLHNSNETYNSLKKQNIEYNYWFKKIKNFSIYQNSDNFKKIKDEINYQNFVIYKNTGEYLKMFKFFFKTISYKKKFKLLLILLIPNFIIKILKKAFYE